eukprot:COSAG02_NODE_32095_length_522_cov_1.092199_1_plen_122_part_10
MLALDHCWTGTTPRRVILEPGDVLFVPAGWPHAVRNLPGPSTIAISANYVDGSNFHRHVQELHWQAIAETQQAHTPGLGAGATATQSETGYVGTGTEETGPRVGRTASLLKIFEAADFNQSM